MNLWADGDDAVQISVSEATTGAHLTAVVEAFGLTAGFACRTAPLMPDGGDPDQRIPDPPGVPHASQRDRDDAVPAPAVRLWTWRWTGR